jgi:DNA-binding FadR family transcriptional regulator
MHAAVAAAVQQRNPEQAFAVMRALLLRSAEESH